MIKTNYEIIKGLVEKRANVKDISIKGKANGISLVRFVYYQLCYDYLGESYAHAAAQKTINRAHNNSRDGLGKFEKLKGQEFFNPHMELYVVCGIELLQLESRINNLIELTY